MMTVKTEQGNTAKFRFFIQLMVVKLILAYDITYIFYLFFCK